MNVEPGYLVRAENTWDREACGRAGTGVGSYQEHMRLLVGVQRWLKCVWGGAKI